MKVLTNNQYYSQIADVIREQNGTSNTYTPPQMVRALKDLFYEEVEGVPPITFQGIGENLLDYRIDGASGGAGERTKNLLNNTLNTQTKSGVTFTVNENKSVTCNGKNQNENQALFVTIGDYSATNDIILSGGVSGGNLSSYILRAYTLTDNPVVYYNEGDGVTLPAGNDYRIQIRIAGGYTCNNLTFYPMIRLATIEDNSYEPYGYKAPVKIEGKNLVQNICTSRTSTTGLTITVNSDKSVIVDGTTNDGKTTGIALGGNTVLGKGTFILSGCPEGGSGETYRLVCIINDGGTQKNVIDYGDGDSVTLTSDDATIINNGFYLAVKSCDNKTFYPMIRRAEIADGTYEPYIEPTTTNIYLDEPILENESISLSDTNTNIPTIRGTNVLTVDTTVQPSNVYIKSRHESSYETAMRERYEEAQLDALESGGE